MDDDFAKIFSETRHGKSYENISFLLNNVSNKTLLVGRLL